MSEKGKLIQSVGSTFKLMIVITRGLIALALDNKLDKGIISPKNILKSVFIIEGEEDNHIEYMFNTRLNDSFSTFITWKQSYI